MEHLAQAIRKEQEERTAEAFTYVRLGYCTSWAEEHKQPGDEGIRRYCTPTRWKQYQAGKISRAQIVDCTIKRINRHNEKALTEKLNKMQWAASSPDAHKIIITVNWVKSKTWGMNPHAEIKVFEDAPGGYYEYHGTASGCGYDKQSAAIAEALNQSRSILKALYIAENNRLQLTEEGDTSRRAVIGYASGYNALPAFEGGCGVSCFRKIFENIGFKWEDTASGKTFDVYTITRRREQ